MVKPKWIGALLLALLVAGGFAWLGHWQLSHAITTTSENPVDPESVRSIESATGPGEIVTDGVAGTVLRAAGSFVQGDFDVVEQRRNGEEVGSWVVGHFVTEGSPSGHLPVAIGWAQNSDQAWRALESVAAVTAGQQFSIEGRYMPSDGAIRPEAGTDARVIHSMVPAQLVNLWQPFEGGAYAGYLVVHPADSDLGQVMTASGLEAIDSVPPLPAETINWLNLFYAIEWVVFAGFAVFFWFRLVRDDWEKIHELKEHEKLSHSQRAIG